MGLRHVARIFMKTDCWVACGVPCGTPFGPFKGQTRTLLDRPGEVGRVKMAPVFVPPFGRIGERLAPGVCVAPD